MDQDTEIRLIVTDNEDPTKSRWEIHSLDSITYALSIGYSISHSDMVRYDLLPKPPKPASSFPDDQQQADYPTATVYSEIARAAKKDDERLESCARYWTWMRGFDTDGSGKIAKADLIAGLGVNRSTVNKNLKKGLNIFWTEGPIEDGTHCIFLIKPSDVADIFNIEFFSNKGVKVPLDAIKHYVSYRAHAYGSFHTGRKRIAPITRDTTKEETGHCARTQRKYEKEIGMVKQTNWRFHDLYSDHMYKVLREGDGIAAQYFVDGRNMFGHGTGAELLVSQMANTYLSARTHTPLNNKHTKRLNKDLRTIRSTLPNYGSEGKERFRFDQHYLDINEDDVVLEDGENVCEKVWKVGTTRRCGVWIPARNRSSDYLQF